MGSLTERKITMQVHVDVGDCTSCASRSMESAELHGGKARLHKSLAILDYEAPEAPVIQQQVCKAKLKDNVLFIGCKEQSSDDFSSEQSLQQATF